MRCMPETPRTVPKLEVGRSGIAFPQSKEVWMFITKCKHAQELVGTLRPSFEDFASPFA